MTEKSEKEPIIIDPLTVAIQNFRKVTGIQTGDLVEAIHERTLSLEEREKLARMVDELTENIGGMLQRIINEASPKESGFPEAALESGEHPAAKLDKSA